MHDLSDVRHVKRIVVGSDNPARLCTQAENEARLQELNDCLTGMPRGTLLSTERSFTLVRIGEHQVVLQWIAYHVGFARKPPPPAARPPAPQPWETPSRDEPGPAPADVGESGHDDPHALGDDPQAVHHP